MRHPVFIPLAMFAFTACEEPTMPITEPTLSLVPVDEITIIDLGTFGGTFSRAREINNLGQVTGVFGTSSSDQRAFLWHDGEMIDLGTLGGTSSFGRNINDLGQVVGWSKTPSGDTHHAFLWQDGEMMDLGTLGGARSAAEFVNNLSQVVGSSLTASSQEHAFFWENGHMQDVGTLGGTSRARALNDLGDRKSVV